MVLVNFGFSAADVLPVAAKPWVAYCSSARQAIFWRSMIDKEAQEAKKKNSWTLFALGV